MSDTEESNGTATPPPYRRLRLLDLQGFTLGPNSRERVLCLLEKISAGELLQQTAAAADALALQQAAATGAEKQAARKAIFLAVASGDTEAAKDLQQLLQLLIKAIQRCFEIDELRDSILSQPEASDSNCASLYSCCCYCSL